MKILLVNDDGYQAQGLKLLHEKLKNWRCDCRGPIQQHVGEERFPHY